MSLLAVNYVMADGDVLFLNENGSAPLSQLSLRVIPGTSNSTSFRAVAQNGNISSLAFFGFSLDLNVSVMPANRTLLPDGDYQLVTVSASVANNTQAGFRAASIMVLTTKPEQRLLPLIVEIPSTTQWNVTPETLAKNVTVKEFGTFNITLTNTGNIPINGHVSLVDLRGLVFFDASDFTLSPDKPISRPLYFFIPNMTPGSYPVTLTFVDSLQNTRQVVISFTLPDTTAPHTNITLSRAEIYPGQKVLVTVDTVDDVNVSTVRWRLGTGNVSEASRVEFGKYSFELSNLTVGNHSLAVLANDTSTNLGTANLTFEVRPFEYITGVPQVDFLKFRPGEFRQVKILSSITRVELNITLKALAWDNLVNNSLNFSIEGVTLEPGISKAVSASGDVYLAARALNYTRFNGVLEIVTPPEIANPAPQIAFRGEVGNFSVTPAFNLSLPGFQSLAVCEPHADTAYENSYIACEARFPVDTMKENVGIIGSPVSLQSERQGYQTEISAWKEKTSGAQLWNWVLLGLIVFVIGAFAFKKYVYDEYGW